jgi:hypothetical protein
LKIRGQTTFSVEPEEFEIMEGVTVTLRPAKSTLIDSLQRRLPAPRAPSKPMMKPGGGGYLKENGKIVSQSDENDPTFLAATTEHGICMMIAVFREGTREDSGVEFDAVEPATGQPEDWKAYYLALRAELDAAGFSLVALRRVSDRVMSISGLSNEVLEAEARDFS